MTTTSLVDVNLWLALLLADHADHRKTLAWYESLAEGEAGLCRIVQLSVLRLLGSRAVAGNAAVSASQAWIGLEQLLEDERIVFLNEPAGLARVWPTLFTYSQPTPKLVADTYLAAFAIAGGHKLVTRDRGFLEFRGLEVEILG